MAGCQVRSGNTECVLARSYRCMLLLQNNTSACNICTMEKMKISFVLHRTEVGDYDKKLQTVLHKKCMHLYDLAMTHSVLTEIT